MGHTFRISPLILNKFVFFLPFVQRGMTMLEKIANPMHDNYNIGVFNELEDMWFQSDLNSVGGSNSSSAEDLFRLSENLPTMADFQFHQNLPSMNYLNHPYYQKKCDGLCEWTCKLCKKRDPSDRRRNATLRERRRLKRVNEAYDGLKKCAVRNPSQRLPKVQILRAAIHRIEQLQRMLYTDEQLKSLQNRADGVAKPKHTHSFTKSLKYSNTVTAGSDLGSLNELVKKLGSST